MGEAKRRKLAGNTEPKVKREIKREIQPTTKRIVADPSMAMIHLLALLANRRFPR